MNSRAEFNRCKVPRITTKNRESEEKLEDDEDERLKLLIRDLRIKKRSRKAEEETLSLRAACIEISNDNYVAWKRRRLDQERDRENYGIWGDKVLLRKKSCLLYTSPSPRDS